VVEFDPRLDYPLGSRRPDLVTTPAGTQLEALTLPALREGRIDPPQLRATADTLRRQSAIARAAGRSELADNLARAAELASIPDDVILDAYTALRPHRSTASELDEWADRLETRYGAGLLAAFVRDARSAYVDRNLLKVERGRAL
jgi:propanediol dehydratase small subunit